MATETVKKHRRLALSNKNAPKKIPLYQTVVLWLLLDRLHPAGWIVGMSWTLMVLVWIAFLVDWCLAEELELGGVNQKRPD